MKGQGGRTYARVAEFIPRAVGLQIPRGDYPEISEKEAVRKAPEARGRSAPGSVPATRNRSGGRASDA